MLKITKPSPNRMDIHVAGAIGTEQMREGLDSLISQAEDMRNGKLFYKIVDFEMPSMGALAVELQLMPQLFQLISKFKKCAVVSDAGWIRTAAEIEGALIPSLEIKSFPVGVEDRADDWLTKSAAIEDDEDEDEEENFPV